MKKRTPPTPQTQNASVKKRKLIGASPDHVALLKNLDLEKKYGFYNRLPDLVVQRQVNYFPDKLKEPQEPSISTIVLTMMSDTLKNQEQFEKKLEHKELILENPTKIPSVLGPEAQIRRQMIQQVKRATIGSREKRAKRLLTVPKDREMDYDVFLTLHEMWKSYIKTVLSNSPDTDVGTSNQRKGTKFSEKEEDAGIAKLPAHQVESRLLTSDFHGAKVRVMRCKCPSFIGIEGIIAQETQETFKIAVACAPPTTPPAASVGKGRSARIVTVGKRQTVFALDVVGWTVVLYGQHLRMRTFLRSGKKFKKKDSVEIPWD